MSFVLAVVVVLIVLVTSELWWRKRQLHTEFSRKFVHITVGSFVAFWPYFLTANEIKLLSIAFLIGVGVSKRFHVFQAIHSVQRPTWGEVWFALMVGALAFLIHHPHVYTVALLEMSLADGLAAVVGTRYGNRHRYVVFGSPKSMIGTLTFFLTSCVILIGYIIWTPYDNIGWLLLPIAVGATMLENVAVRGLDNLVVPLLVGCTLFLLAK